MFACLILRIFLLIFLVRTVLMSHKKLVGIVFRVVFSAKPTGLTLTGLAGHRTILDEIGNCVFGSRVACMRHGSIQSGVVCRYLGESVDFTG